MIPCGKDAPALPWRKRTEEGTKTQEKPARFCPQRCLPSPTSHPGVSASPQPAIPYRGEEHRFAQRGLMKNPKGTDGSRVETDPRVRLPRPRSPPPGAPQTAQELLLRLGLAPSTHFLLHRCPDPALPSQEGGSGPRFPERLPPLPGAGSRSSLAHTHRFRSHRPSWPWPRCPWPGGAGLGLGPRGGGALPARSVQAAGGSGWAQPGPIPPSPARPGVASAPPPLAAVAVAAPLRSGTPLAPKAAFPHSLVAPAEPGLYWPSVRDENFMDSRLLVRKALGLKRYVSITRLIG